MTRANEVLAHFLDAFIVGLDPDGKAYPMVVVAGPNGSGKSTFWHQVVKPRFGGLVSKRLSTFSAVFASVYRPHVARSFDLRPVLAFDLHDGKRSCDRCVYFTGMVPGDKRQQVATSPYNESSNARPPKATT